jgi:hypothetical protein
MSIGDHYIKNGKVHRQSRSPHSALCSLLSALCTPHSALCTLLSALRTPHSALRTPHSALCSLLSATYARSSQILPLRELHPGKRGSHCRAPFR